MKSFHRRFIIFSLRMEGAAKLASKVLTNEKLTKKERTALLKKLTINVVNMNSEIIDLKEKNMSLRERVNALERTAPKEKFEPPTPVKVAIGGCDDPDCIRCKFLREEMGFGDGDKYRIFDADGMKEMLRKAKEAMNEINKEEKAKEKEEEKEGEKNE